MLNFSIKGHLIDKRCLTQTGPKSMRTPTEHPIHNHLTPCTHLLTEDFPSQCQVMFTVFMLHHLLSTGSDEREWLSVGSIPVRIVPTSQYYVQESMDMKTVG